MGLQGFIVPSLPPPPPLHIRARAARYERSASHTQHRQARSIAQACAGVDVGLPQYTSCGAGPRPRRSRGSPTPHPHPPPSAFPIGAADTGRKHGHVRRYRSDGLFRSRLFGERRPPINTMRGMNTLVKVENDTGQLTTLDRCPRDIGKSMLCAVREAHTAKGNLPACGGELWKQ